MARQTTSEIFRTRASENDWKQVVSDHEKFSKDEFKKKYDFSWSSIMNDAAERGFYKKKRIYNSSLMVKQTSSEIKKFDVSDRPVGKKKITRSVQIDEDVYERLKKLEDQKSQYTHFAILNQLLSDALGLYGY